MKVTVNELDNLVKMMKYSLSDYDYENNHARCLSELQSDKDGRIELNDGFALEYLYYLTDFKLRDEDKYMEKHNYLKSIGFWDKFNPWFNEVQERCLTKERNII